MLRLSRFVVETQLSLTSPMPSPYPTLPLSKWDSTCEPALTLLPGLSTCALPEFVSYVVLTLTLSLLPVDSCFLP